MAVAERERVAKRDREQAIQGERDHQEYMERSVRTAALSHSPRFLLTTLVLKQREVLATVSSMFLSFTLRCFGRRLLMLFLAASISVL